VLPSWVDRSGWGGSLRVGYYVAVAAYLISWIALARSYRPDTRLLPLALGAALLGLVCLRGASALAGDDGSGGPGVYVPDDPDLDGGRATVAFGWLGGLVAAVVLAGLVPGIGIVTTGFIARYDRPRRAVLVGPATALAVYVLFVLLLDMPTYEPVAVRIGGVIGG